MRSAPVSPDDDAAMRFDYRAIKGALGALAVIAAMTVAAAASMTAWLFGALAAASLTTAAIWVASLEFIAADRARSWRVAAWGALAVGWMACAAMLLHAPAEQDGLVRSLVSALIAGGGACRAWRWQVDRDHTLTGVLVAFALACLAVAATWSNVWFNSGDMTAMAICVGCAFELFNCGSFWLGEALIGPSRWVASDALPLRAVMRAA